MGVERGRHPLDCPDCGTRMPVLAVTCPACGRDRAWWRRPVIWVMADLTILALLLAWLL